MPARAKAKAKPKKPITAKKSKKPTTRKSTAKKKPAKKAAKKYTEAMFEKHFFKLTPQLFKQMCDEWNEKNLKIKLKPQRDYDHWLNYFKTLPASHIRILVLTGQDILSAEAYSALRRWHDIISNPARIDKIHQSGLTNPKGKNDKGIVAMALKNDRYGVLCATRDRIAEKLEKGAGARDTAALARELTEVMTQISDYEKRQGPKRTTVLGKLLEGMPGSEMKGASAKKRSGYNGGGRRNTSYASRVTIEDVEGASA